MFSALMFATPELDPKGLRIEFKAAIVVVPWVEVTVPRLALPSGTVRFTSPVLDVMVPTFIEPDTSFRFRLPSKA